MSPSFLNLESIGFKGRSSLICRPSLPMKIEVRVRGDKGNGSIFGTDRFTFMSNPNPFLATVEKVLGGSVSSPRNSPAQLLAQWQQFVNWCDEGYRWDVSEYWNELSVREKLEQLLTADRLQPFQELGELKTRVGETDIRFKSLLMPDVKLPNREQWWEQGVLKRAGEQYAEYFREAHGIEVEVA